MINHCYCCKKCDKYLKGIKINPEDFIAYCPECNGPLTLQSLGDIEFVKRETGLRDKDIITKEITKFRII